MDTVLDSDGENDIPPLQYSQIDRDLLANALENQPYLLESEIKSDILKWGLSSAIAAGSPTLTILQEEGEGPTGSIGTSTADEEPLETLNFNNHPVPITRSLRKRTFASRHPYIADQASWLGICTIEGVNELFRDQDDLKTVTKVLNDLYLRRKKRYPSEERYKAKSFYDHLGKSRALALRGDLEAQESEARETSDQESQNEEGNVQEDALSALSQLPEDNLPDNSQDSVEELQYLPRTAEPDHDQVSSDSGGSSYELEDEFIKIGGKYRRLKNILRGVLPASAMRQSNFQARSRPVPKRALQRPAEPRKGLAVRRQGTGSNRIDDLEEELYSPNLELHANHPATTSSERLLDLSILREPSNSPILLSSLYDSEEEVLIFDLQHSIPSFDYTLDLDELPDAAGDNGMAEEDHSVDAMLSIPEKRKHSPRRVGDVRKAKPKTNKGTLKSQSQLRVQASTQLRIYKSKFKSPQTKSLVLKPVILNGTRKHQNSKTRSMGQKRKQRKLRIEDLPASGPDSTHQRARQPAANTVIYEIESETRYIKPSARSQFILSNTIPCAYWSGSETLSFVGPTDLQRIHTIGDGFIFCSDVDSVAFEVDGNTYHFGLFKQDEALATSISYLSHLRNVLQFPDRLLDAKLKSDVLNSILEFAKWLLIWRGRPSNLQFHSLRDVLNNLNTIHRKIIQSQLLEIHALLVVVFYIYAKLELLYNTAAKISLNQDLDLYIEDFWHSFFQTYTAEDLLKANSGEALLVALKRILFASNSQNGSWWTTISRSIKELGLLSSKEDTINMVYSLAKLFPEEHAGWVPFLLIFKGTRSLETAKDCHLFLDMCDAVTVKLGYSLEEHIVMSLYSVFSHRKFANLPDERQLPDPLGLIVNRHDIPSESVFERFLGLIYAYISELESSRDVRRLLSKLTPSSHYVYLKGRENQIIFANRINLITLLSQVSDATLMAHFDSLISLIAESRELFLYERSVDAFEILVHSTNSLPLTSFRSLIKMLAESRNYVVGVAQLQDRLIRIFLEAFSGNAQDNLGFFRSLVSIEWSLISMLSHHMLLSYALCVLQESRIKCIALTEVMKTYLSSYQTPLLTFLDQTMRKAFPNKQHEDQKFKALFELSAQVWIELSHALNQNWSVIAYQKFPYLGSADSRECVQPYIVSAYLKTFEPLASIIFQVDTIIIKALVARRENSYLVKATRLVASLPYSIFVGRSDLYGNFSNDSPPILNLPVLIGALKLFTQKSDVLKGDKTSFFADIIRALLQNYNARLLDRTYQDFCSRFLTEIQRFSREYLSENDDFWTLMVAFGFPDKFTHSKWAGASETKKLSILVNDLRNALAYGHDYLAALDKWLVEQETNNNLFFALLELSIVSSIYNPHQWVCIAYLLHYARAKFERYQFSVRNSSFIRILELLSKAAHISFDQREPIKFAREQAMAISTQLFIWSHYQFLGYKDYDSFARVAWNFIDAFYSPTGESEGLASYTEHEIREFVNESALSSALPILYLETHSVAISDTMESLKRILLPDSIKTVANFQFAF